jgi:hypothetical protein
LLVMLNMLLFLLTLP